jgi:5,10-methylenetetrahydromethanopterin reductase
MTTSAIPGVSIGLFAGSDATTLDDAVGRAAAAAADGFAAWWLPQTNSLESLAVLTVAAREVPRIHLGTAVVPIQGRHPFPHALAALTAADAAGPGRLTLGLGVTHPPVSQGWFGVPYRGIVDVCAEVLEVLNGLLGPERRADLDGEHVSSHIATTMQGPAPSVMLAGLGPRMVELTGRATDGTITWMTGPRTLGERITPALRAAAAAAGRPAPRIVVGIPVCVTDDPADARERLATGMERTATMPSYRRQVEAEGIEHPVDLVVLGDEATVSERLAGLAAAGMTELCANIMGSPEERARTRAHLAAMARADA